MAQHLVVLSAWAGLGGGCHGRQLDAKGEQDIGHRSRNSPQTVVFSPIWEFFFVSRQDQQELVVLGRAIGQIRRELGVSAEALAAASDIERRSLSALEAGRLNPTYELLLSLAEGLGIR